MADDVSLRDELAAQFSSSQSVPVDPPAEPEAAAQEPAKVPEASQAPVSDGPVRDEHGRFAKLAETGQDKVAEAPIDAQAKAPAAQAAEPIQPPASWSATAKSQWASLPPSIQAEVAKRELDVTRGFTDRANQLKRYEPLEAVIAPHRERLALAGLDEAAYVRTLVTADEMLRGPNRLQALQQIAQSYQIPLQSLAQDQGASPQGQVHPVIQQLQDQVATLTQQLTQRGQAEAQAQTSQLQSVIERFAADPANLYFENVRPQVAALLQTGVQGATWDEMLKNAYEQAVWAHPETRQALTTQQAEKQRQAEAEAARAKVQQARTASGSIIGTPTPGGAPAQEAAPTVRDELMRQFAAH